MAYAHGIDGTMLITGEVGGGKSTSLRWSLSLFRSSQALVLSLVGTSGGFAEVLKIIAMELGLEASKTSRTRLLAEIRAAVRDTVKIKKQHVLLVVDEANLLRVEILAELHTLTQFDHDSRNLLTLVLCGQNSLFDKLQMHSSLPLASRVVSRSHLEPLKRTAMDECVAHHLGLAGVRKRLFEEAALDALDRLEDD